MLKPIKFLKRVQGFRQYVFNLLPIVSLGGISLILGTFAIVPNFMNLAHAEENTTSPKQKDITLSMSVDSTFHKFDDIYLNANETNPTAPSSVLMIPTVKKIILQDTKFTFRTQMKTLACIAQIMVLVIRYVLPRRRILKIPSM